MSLSADDLARTRGRPVEALTRRDVALALLEIAPAPALESLPDLRRELTRAGNAFSAAFWDSCERTLERIAAGQATGGDLDRWLESTGTHPTRMVGLVVWEDEEERGPVAEEVHAQLVGYLEEAVEAGRIDPDRLAAGDPDAHAAYVALQEEWLLAEDEVTRAPAWRVLDEEDEELFAAWDEVDRLALAELERILGEVGDRPCPTDELGAVVARLRAELAEDRGFGALLTAAAWVDPDEPPVDDAEWWLGHAQGTIELAGEPPDEADFEALSSWATLEHADWLAAVAALARGGPGASADPRDLARAVGQSPDVDAAYETVDDEALVAAGLSTAVQMWRELGAVDRDDRLTPLGWWGLPEALRRVWTKPTDPDPAA